MLEKVFYLGFLVFFNLCLLTFMMLKIVPIFEKMFSEFDLQLPVMTQALIHFSQLLANYWFLFAPVFLIVIYLFTASILYYMGLLPQRLPLLRSLWWRIDSAWVLRWLATGVRQSARSQKWSGCWPDTFPKPACGPGWRGWPAGSIRGRSGPTPQASWDC